MATHSPADTSPRWLAPGIAMFIGGGVLMTVEIIGGLTIAPSFGSNVFVWGSVISVFLAALAAGYAIGGRIPPRRAGNRLLALLLALAGLLILAIPWFAPIVNRSLLSLDLGDRLNPLRILAAAVASFFLPTLLLGAVSPLSVTIAGGPLRSAGRSVGRLYAVNALGSVAGALGATFILALFFGNRAVLCGCGAVLLLAALVVAFIRSARPAEPAAASPAKMPSLPPPTGLRPLVIAVGVVLMSLEVLGGAVIAPYFGSNVFVWGSVIAVFLGAMTLGYRAGGRLADARPQPELLAGIIAAAGLFVLLIPLAAPPFCRAVQNVSLSGSLNIVRPFAIAGMLYFVPTFLFAMVAPFAVRLAASDSGRIGSIAGRLYSLSTLGNAVGVLLTTFLLISTIGKTRSLEAAGALAVAAAVNFILTARRPGVSVMPAIISSTVAVALAAGLIAVPKPPLVSITYEGERIDRVAGGWTYIANSGGLRRRIRAEAESPYHHIAIIEETNINNDGTASNVRQLRFDQYTESAVYLNSDATAIAEPYKSATTYADMLHLPVLFQPDARDVLVVGAGGGIIPTLFRRLHPQMTIDVVEIDPAVIDVADKWFDLTPGPQLRVHVQDGRMFVHNSTAKYDIIILDAYTAGGRIPAHLTTREFLEDVRSHLRPDGVVLMNVIGSLEGRQSRFFRAELKTFKSVFDRDRLYVVPKVLDVQFDKAHVTNLMILATGPDLRRMTRDRCVALAKERFGDDPGQIPIPWLPLHAARMLSELDVSAIPLNDVPLLTDDFAPVDLLVAGSH